jgi:hypothetical protein
VRLESASTLVDATERTVPGTQGAHGIQREPEATGPEKGMRARGHTIPLARFGTRPL